MRRMMGPVLVGLLGLGLLLVPRRTGDATHREEHERPLVTA